MNEADEILAAAIADSTYGHRLVAAPPAAPLAVEDLRIRRVVDLARRHLRLPARVVVALRAGGRDVCGGRCVLEDGQPRILLNVDLGLAEMTHTLLHELQHAEDMATGRWDAMPRLELERRAIEFAAAMARAYPELWA